MEEHNDLIKLKNVPANFVMLLKLKYKSTIIKAIEDLDELLSSSSQSFTSTYLYHMDLGDINYYLFSCEKEEQAYWGSALYQIPNFHSLVFAGFAGVKKILSETSLNNDFNHPLYLNIREGDWFVEHHLARIVRYNKPLHDKFRECVAAVVAKIKMIPALLKPKYVHKFVSLIISAFENRFLEKIKTPEFFLKNDFYRQLVLAVPQFLTSARSNGLVLASAGLPFFSVGTWKNWGRDTFISFNGIFMVTGLYAEARKLLLFYARFLRHGLVPNMLDPPRYNSRDATWWFVYSVKNYLEETSDYKVLNEPVKMEFLADGQEEHFRLLAQGAARQLTLLQVLQEVFQKHAEGIHFREWNAPEIDAHMTYLGFNVSLFVDWRNGFIFGGNKNNCLTWMDKLGSSAKAKNRGVPATSRNGAPIELTALLYSGVKMMKMLYEENYSPNLGITLGNGTEVTYKKWQVLIKANFEKYYWIPNDEAEYENYKIEKAFVFRRGIYKDCISENPEDYQLRPNGLVAVAIVSSLVTKENVVSYLDNVKRILLVG